MRDFGAEYESRIAPFIENKEITLPFFSTVSNSKITDARKLGASYWRQNLESPVLFSGAVQNILKETGFKAFLEIGAHSALSGPLRQIFEDAGLKSDPAYIPTLSRNKENSRAQMIFAAGLAHVHGLRISLASINGGTGTTLTNLPTYPWDHSRRYWHESRVTRDWRFRKNPHHELLGSLVMESSGIEPSWRNLLRLEEVQWLADHVLQGNIIFPGMAYAAMAGEAVLQLKGDPTIDDYSIKNLVIKSPLLLADSKTFEIITTLKPVSITDFIDGEWYSFSVVSNDGTGWTKHCQGLVMAGCRSMIEFDEVPKYSRALNPDLCFKYPHRLGFHYGPHFQRFQKVSVDPTGCNASASILNFAEEPASRYTLHPATMDHVLQLFPMALSHGIERKFPLVVPASVGYLYVGGSAAEASIHARVSDGGTGLFLGNAEMLAGGKLIMSASDVRGFPVDNQGQESGSNIPGISQIQWAPDIDLMSPEAVFPRTNVRKPRDEVTQAAKKLGILYSLETTACFSASNPEASQFLARYRWVAAEALQIGQGRDDMFKHVQTWAGLTSEARQSLIDNLSSTLDEDDKREFSKIAACMKYIYRNFRHITTGQGFLEDTDSCIETFKASLYSQLNWNHFLATIGHSNPVMRVLEIGSGSVFVTKAVLNQLRSPSGSPLFSRYVFTSHTAEVVAAAQTDMRHDIEFSLFDITRDPVEQGFDPHSFDLIIAFNVRNYQTHASAAIQLILSDPQAHG
jgi:acyl transferase domain-containing protein